MDEFTIRIPRERPFSAVGSLAGTMRVKSRAVDFGVTDVPLEPEELARLGLEQFPIIIGGVVVAVNLDGIGRSELRMTGPLLAKIFLGSIDRWSDPAIKALNPSLSLPDAPITVIHRADGSGTTYNFTAYLTRVSPEWKQKVSSGLLVSFPKGTAEKGNDGVAQAVRRTPGSIGYVEYAQASELALTHARLQNRAGTFVAPSVNSFQAAAASVDWSKAKDFNVMLVDAAGESAYPITATVFVLIHKQARRARVEETLDFFRWSLDHGAQTASRLGYVPLSPPLVARVTKYWQTSFGLKPTPVGL